MCYIGHNFKLLGNVES